MFGVGTAFLAPTFLRANAPMFGHTDNLLLSCMDYRLVDDNEKYMAGRGLKEKYDHIVLAGASLGAFGDVKRPWHQMFLDHLEIAKKLHGIHKVIIMDHRDCGAYNEVFGAGWVTDEATETNKHQEKMNSLSSLIKRKYTDLEVETLIMSLDGTVTG